MMIFENNDKAIYNFFLSAREEANILSQFMDDNHDLLFPFFECNFVPCPELQKYIEERTVLKSKEQVFDISNPFLENKLIYWYKPLDFADLTNIIERDSMTYRCIVVPKNGKLSEYRFKLFTYEHAIYKGKETRVLWIDEAIENDFIQNVYPKINDSRHSCGTG
ncbi:hypothetical protein [Paenibacillus fonticola]|uniref:hypothetical protein n=1 Tax=Paenibacillus fonticola TaxID=379896 RepID=UPI000377EA18|nr:hypothetical protein [Paenibacillus fonticola]